MILKKNSQKEKKNIIGVKENKRSPKWFSLILILIPILFFVFLEILLRIFNYGMDNRQWVDATEDKLMLNSEIA
jgi:hypothetical protein